MAHDLITQQEGKYLALAPQPNERAAAILRSCLSGSFREFGTLMMQRLPDPSAREVLAERQKALLESAHSDKKAIYRIIGEMLAGYRHKGVRPDEDAIKVVDLYWKELSLDPKIPTWAVWRACSAIRSGSDPARIERVGIRLYEAPTTMMLRALCDTYVWEVRAEMMSIADVLRGRQARPEVPADVHARTAKEFRALADEMMERNSFKNELKPPLTRDQLVEMAGSEEMFNALPDRKVSGPERQLVEFADNLAAQDGHPSA